MILVTGGTGTTGREIIGELQRVGANGVRALVRDTSKASFIRDAGFELAEGDFDRAHDAAILYDRPDRSFVTLKRRLFLRRCDIP